MAKVEIIQEGPKAGIWVTTEKGQTVGLVAEDGIGAYLMVHATPNDSYSVPFVIAAYDGDAETEVQIPGPGGKLHNVKVVSINKLTKLLANA